MKNFRLYVLAIMLVSVMTFGIDAHAEDVVNVSASVEASSTVNTGETKPVKPGILNTIKNTMKDRVETKKEIKDVRQENKMEIRDLKSKMASSSDIKRGDIMKKRIGNHFEIMIIRINATIERQEALLARIVSRIEKVKAAGGNTAEAEKIVSEAKDHIANAKKLLEELKLKIEANASVDVSLMSSTTRNTLLGMRKFTLEIEKELRFVHSSLMKIVGLLRGMSQINTQN